MAKAKDEKIPNISEPWEGYAGSRVEEFIKEQFGSKFGYMNLRFIDSENMYHIESFASEADFLLYEEDHELHKDLLLQDARIPISTVTGDSYTGLLTTNMSNTANIITTGDVFNISLNYRAVKIGQLGNENAQSSGTLHVQRRVGDGEWTNALTISNALTSLDPTDDSTFMQVDIGAALINARMQIRVRASFDYEDENGTQKTVNTVWVLIGQMVTKTDIRLELDTDYSKPITLRDIDNNYENFKINYIAYGDAEKTLHYQVKGSKGTLVGSATSNESGEIVNAINVNTTADGYGIGTHGVKIITAWLECSDGLGGTIKSNTLVNQVMVAVDDTDTRPYLLLQNVAEDVVNYIQTKVCEYAIYSPDKETPINTAFLVTESVKISYEQDKPTEHFRLEQEVMPQTQNQLIATIEIETETTDDLYAFFRVRRLTEDGDTDFIKESIGIEDYRLTVDNKSSFMPVAGSTFHINPKVRSNNESNPARILNAKNKNAVVPSTFEGFGFVTDGWIESGGQRVLRVPAGGKLTIGRNIFEKFRNNPDSRMTFELDFAVHNVTNTTDPIIDITDGIEENFRGIRMNAIDGWMCCKTSNALDDCLFSWQEGVRTHLVFNIENRVSPQGPDVTYNGDVNAIPDPQDSSKVITSVPIARIFINGVLSREIAYSLTDASEWSDGNCSIVIGNEGCDIDIYSIRAYEGDTVLSPKNILLKNYLSTLISSEEKQKVFKRNDITDESGRISLDKARALGLNCMIWHGTLVSKINSEEYTGYYEYHRYDENGNYLPEYSGTNCIGTKAMNIKGQGSTAKTYYDWNVQDDNSKVKFLLKDGGHIRVKLADFHESIEVSAPTDGEATDAKDNVYTGKVVKIKGGNLGKNFPAAETAKAYPYDDKTGEVLVPDGWIDGNGKYRGAGYCVAEGTALAQKKVIKINYASSMQNHLLGACKSYDLLHRAVVGDTPLQKQVPTAVGAKHTEPFLFFHEVGGNIYYKGLGNYGAAKMDKVAWGYTKGVHPKFALIEGSDNNQTMTDFRVPFDKKTAVYNVGEEYWQYGNAGSWDFDGGKTTDAEGIQKQIAEGWTFAGDYTKSDAEAPTAEIRDLWAMIANYVYLHGTNIDYFDGTYNEFVNMFSTASATEKAKIMAKKWWFTQSDGDYKAYCLYRYDALNSDTKPWVNAGLLNGSTYSEINLSTDDLTKQSYENNKGRYSAMNAAFIADYTRHMHDTIKYIINEDSLIFNYCYVLMFLAGTDNSSKNTYFKICPVAESFDYDESFNTWYKKMFHTTKNFDFANCYRVYLDGDDMDSILRTNNNSHQTKPYYIERRYPYNDKDVNQEDCLYEGMNNLLFNYVEEYAKMNTDALPDMMNRILTKAQSLVGENDVLYGNPISKVSAWGFLHKFFFNTQYYFPQIAYNEQGRIRYEFPHMVGYVSTGSGARSIRPITQSLGSQLDNELQYMKQRLVYMASFARWSSLCGTSGTLGMTGSTEPSFSVQGTGVLYKFVLKSHQYIYPVFNIGTSKIATWVRLAPSSQLEYTLDTKGEAGDAGVGLYGIDYYTSIGNVGDFEVPKGGVTIQGKRLREFIAEPTSGAPFAPETITITATQLNKFSLKGCTGIKGSLNLSSLTRCQEVDVRGAQLTDAIMPKSNLLHTVRMGGKVKDFAIEDLPKLANLTFENYSEMQNFVVGDNVGNINTATHATGIYNAQRNLEQPNLLKMNILNVDWDAFSADVLRWYAELPDKTQVRFNGVIRINEPSSASQAISHDAKNSINNKFGNVDDATSEDYRGLRLIYSQRDFASAAINGAFYISEDPRGDYNFVVAPSPIYANTQTKIKYTVVPEESPYASYSIDENTGVLTVTEVSDVITEIDIVATIETFYEGKKKVFQATKKIDLYIREAKTGDIVYFDGSYSSPSDYDGSKTPIGICFYVAPRAPERMTINGVEYQQGEIVAELFNPNDKMKRLMVALEDITLNIGSKISWGLSTACGTYNGTTKYPFRWDDIGDLCDISTLASQFFITDSNYNVNETFRQTTDDVLREVNDGFAYYDASLARGEGFAYRESESRLNARSFVNTADALSIDNISLLSLTDGSHKQGDIVNAAYMNTLKIISHRNKVLGSNILHGYDVDGNGSIDDVFIPANTVSPPVASGNTTEMQDLNNAITRLSNIATQSGVDAHYLYAMLYPGASACYAYEPTAKNIADRFKKHNWFLPSVAQLAYLVYYTTFYKQNGDADIFNHKFFTKMNGIYLSCNECTSDFFMSVRTNGALYGANPKPANIYFSLRPICAF